MRGIIVSDCLQGIVAYIVGSGLIFGLIVWIYVHGGRLGSLPAARLALPGPDSGQPLLFFSLTLLPLLSSLCWPDLFVRLYTGSGVDSVERSSAYCAPLALVFVSGLGLLALLASTRPEIAAAPETAWFLLSREAGGAPLLALAGTIVFAASMGNIDATVQSCGAQAANDIVAALRSVSFTGMGPPFDRIEMLRIRGRRETTVKKEKGARFATPSGDTLEIQAMGLGTTVPFRIL